MTGNDLVVVEVAINGATSKARNPNVPTAPEEIAADALACIEGGASIIHNHIDRAGLTGEESAARYYEGWAPVFAARPDALLYPTVNGASGVENMYSHLEPLSKLCPLRVGLADPGSVNFGVVGDDGVPRGAYVYANSHDAIGYQLELNRRLGLGPQLAIFEPGFLRTALVWWHAGAMPPGALIKLYFGGTSGYLIGSGRSGAPFGLPATRRGLDAYLELLDDCPLPWSAAILGGDLTADADFVRAVLDASGHLHLGLEDHVSASRTPSNVELLREAVAIVESTGRTVATPTETVRVLGLP
jgi:uncharacterized protein (DUF849 family)